MHRKNVLYIYWKSMTLRINCTCTHLCTKIVIANPDLPAHSAQFFTCWCHLKKISNNLCKQFASRSGLTEGQTWSVSKLTRWSYSWKNFWTTVKSVLTGHSKRTQKLFFKTDYHLMQVKSIAECSKGSILQYFRPSLSNHFSSFVMYIFEWPLQTGFTVH